MGAIGLNPIRLDRIGLDPIRINAIKLGVPRAASDRPYIDPEVLASLKAVCICYGKSNDDPDRAVVKNLVDPDNPFVISNAAFKLNSGFGKYEVDFTEYRSGNLIYVSRILPNSILATTDGPGEKALLAKFPSNENDDINDYKVEIKLTEGVQVVYKYIDNTGTLKRKYLNTSGIYDLPKSYISKLPSEFNDSIGFSASGVGEIYLSQIPSFQGALVTDGVDDLITSTKTAQEMLGGSTEITVVSMINSIIPYRLQLSYTNAFPINRTNAAPLRNEVSNTGKTGIYGYTYKNNVVSVINNVLGDKNDYTAAIAGEPQVDDRFEVTRTKFNSSVAWYWTFIAKKALTTDQINQVIAYFNLDRTLNPDILCNTIKQGITNENHAEFGDKLIDYSGNGRDIQLNNIAWNKESGIDDDGALCLDGVNDFGKVTGMPIYKDYTVVTDREIFANAGAISSKNNPGAFVETAGNTVYSFGQATTGLNFISTRSISYLSKYSYCGQSITAGAAEDGTDMWLGTIRDNDSRFFNGAIYSLMSFPYSMSEFLIERQLKKHKLGTLYPNMVEWRPVIKSSVELVTKPTFVIRGTSTLLNAGDYIPKDSKLWVIVTMNSSVDELTKFSINGKEITISTAYNPATRQYGFPFIIDNKSPQKINITIDEYIRYEDIIQPYPVLLRFNDENGNEVSWGGKFRVGSTITRIGSAADSNLLPNIYNIFGLLLNGNQVTSSKVIVEKTMVFKAKSAYIFDNNEPKCILSPSRLRIPNSSYKLLGYIPDISGHGNHGKINNSAYAEGSGVNEDGSYQFDGVDDFVTIPTATGGKQVFMKVNSRKSDCYLYDQRNNWTQYLGIVSTKDFIAYNYSNQRGKTYIDGILNENITANDLISITHNITVTNNRDDIEQYFPCIGTSFAKNSFAQMSLYDFMLFDNISTDDKIKELNEYVGIEGNTDDLFNETNI